VAPGVWRFGGNVILAHVVTYVVAGALAYPLLTRQFYEGANPIFAPFFRTPTEPELWAHAIGWLIPGQVLRGLFMAAALYPFYGTLAGWRFRRRFLAIAGLYLVFGFWASAVAAPGTIEGLIYLRPEVTPYAHLMVQPEIVAQGLALGAWLAAWIARTPPHTKQGGRHHGRG
jgi:hypothetical protein